MNDDSRGTHNINNQIKFKRTTLKSSFCNYSNEKGKITISATQADAAVSQQKKEISLCTIHLLHNQNE